MPKTRGAAEATSQSAASRGSAGGAPATPRPAQISGYLYTISANSPVFFQINFRPIKGGRGISSLNASEKAVKAFRLHSDPPAQVLIEAIDRQTALLFFPNTPVRAPRRGDGT
jgi:hypothetical protein